MTAVRIGVGDVFSVPIDDGRVGFGQVVAMDKQDGYFLAIFDRAYPRGAVPSLAAVTSDRVAFLALSLDAKIAAGHWKIVGNEVVRDDIPRPAYKEAVGAPGRVDVVDFAGVRRRRAVTGEVDVLPNRTVVAPLRLEKALRASDGVEPWQGRFDDLRPVDSATTARIFG